MTSANQLDSDIAALSYTKDEPGLTPRERLVLSQIIQGLSSKEIARGLDISMRTVEFHRANLLHKYRAKNTAELMRKVLTDRAT